MVPGKLNLGNGLQNVGFHGDDLRTFRVDPCASFQAYGNGSVADVVRERGTGLTGPLLKMYDPRRPPFPGAAPLARKIVPRLQIRMKNQRQCGEANRGDVPGELSANRVATDFFRCHPARAVFLYVQIAVSHLADFHEVVNPSRFTRNPQTHRAELEVLDVLGRGVTVHVLHKFLHPSAGELHHLVELTSG